MPLQQLSRYYSTGTRTGTELAPRRFRFQHDDKDDMSRMDLLRYDLVVSGLRQRTVQVVSDA